MPLAFYSGNQLHKVTTKKRLEHALLTGRLLSGKGSSEDNLKTTLKLRLACPSLPMHKLLVLESADSNTEKQTQADITEQKFKQHEQTLPQSAQALSTNQDSTHTFSAQDSIPTVQATQSIKTSSINATHDISKSTTLQSRRAFPALCYIPTTPQIRFTSHDSLLAYVSQPEADLSLCDISALDDLSYLFYNSPRTDWSGLEGWNTQQVVNFAHMFDGALKLNAQLAHWDLRSACDLTAMFARCRSFNGDLSAWQTANVQSMAWLFYGAWSFTGSIANWQTRHVQDMQHMLHDARSFNECLYYWDTRRVRNFAGMFAHAVSFTNAPDSFCGWDMAHADDVQGMFAQLASHCTLDLSTWWLPQQVNCQGLFYQSQAQIIAYPELLSPHSQDNSSLWQAPAFKL